VLKRRPSPFVPILAASLATGCELFDTSSLSDKAIRTEKLQCEAKNVGADLEIIASAPVLEVAGQYSSHTSGVSQVFATRVTIRPPDGVSVDRMTRVLQCHSARRLLARGDAPLANDPYFLPDVWLSISVREEQGNFVAVIAADSVADNLRVFQRAKAFAAAQSAALPPAPAM
jgi:hypothetical protein